MTDGPHATEGEKKEGKAGADWVARWPARGKRAAEGKKGRWAGGKEVAGLRGKKKKAEMGWAERVGEREKIFHFPKRFKHFQFKFRLKDLNLK